MSSGVEADIALDAAVVLTLGLNRALGRAAGLGAAGAGALAALAAAQAAARQGAIDELERYDRAIRDVLDRNARIAALAESRREVEQRFGVQPGVLPEPLAIAAQSAGELAAWSARTDAAIGAAERDLSQRVAAAVAGRIFDAPAAGLTSDVGRRPPEPTEATEASEASEPTEAGAADATPEPVAAPQVAETLRRVLSRLPPDTAASDYQHVSEAAEQVAGAATPSAAEGLLTEVRLRVQRATENARRRRAEFARQAAEQEALEQDEAERQYVLDAITTAFTDMGYEVDAGFETLTAEAGEVLLTREEWPLHAVKMRLDDASQIRAALLRTEAPRGDEERRLDVEREQQWCAAFEEARARLAAAGVGSDVRWRLEPGLQQLPVAAAPRAAWRTAATKAAVKAKERHAQPGGGRPDGEHR